MTGAAPIVLDLSARRRFHVVGVGGAGMSAIATALSAMGHQVTGSDLKASPVTERLVGQGIQVAIGHRPSNVSQVDVLTFSPAVAETNEELAEARRRGIPVMPRSAMLAAITRTRKALAVAGTHGKTTTSSMLSLALVEAGFRPSFLIGADVNETGTNAVWDTGEWLVVEADESYGTFNELAAEMAVLTSVEPDHLDHYGGFEALRAAFEGFLGNAAARGVVSADDPVAAELGIAAGAATVGVSDGADYRMTNLELGRSSMAFDLSLPGGWPAGRLRVPIPGTHNARNAALAAAAAVEVGAPFDAVAAALARFAGVPRRFEFRGELNGVTFVDDYAHLPSEVVAAVEAANDGKWSRLVVVFQPHRYTRTAALSSTFGQAFHGSDALVVTDVYGAGERPIPGVSGRLVVDAVLAQDPETAVYYANGREELVDVVRSLLRPGDLCCTLGAGDITTLPDQLMAEPTW